MTICVCVALLFGKIFAPNICHADSRNLTHQGNELYTINAQSLSTQTNPEKEKLSKSKTDFAFGAQLGDFSLNYLMFITHYLAGATMPVFCKNSVLIAPAGPAGVFLPNLWIDNIVFSIASIVYLYFELLVYDHLQKKYKSLEESLNICDQENQPSCQNGKHGEDFHLKALEAQYQGLDFELEMLDQKAEATRATKAAWLLSAVLSLATNVTIGNPPDICLGMYPATLPFLGPTLKDAFQNFQQQFKASSPQGTMFNPMSVPGHGRGISKQELQKIFQKAKDFNSLIMTLTELQMVNTGSNQSPSFKLDLLGPSYHVSDDDFQAMKKWFMKIFRGDFLSQVITRVTPIHTAIATTTEQEFDETLAAKQELTEADNLSDFFNVYKDVSSIFNTTTKTMNLAQGSTFAEDYRKLLVDPIGQSAQLIERTISPQFFKQFADYLGFRNGGETAFLIYLTVVGDLAVLKSRSLLINPLVPSLFPVVGEGTFLFKIVSSVVGAHFANAYRQELLAAKLRIIELKKKLTSTIEAIKNREKDGGVSMTNAPSQSTDVRTTSTTTSQGILCINQANTLSPDSLSSCSNHNNVNANPTIPMEFGNNNFGQVINNIGPNAMAASDNLIGVFNRLMMGNVKGAKGNLNALGNSGAQMAALLKRGLESFHKLNPQKKIKDELSNVEKNISSRIQVALAAARYKGGNLQPSPVSQMSLAGLSVPKEITNQGNVPLTSSEQFNKAKSADTTTLPRLTKFDWYRKKQNDPVAENEFREAMAKEYDFVQNEINDESQQNIFEVITLRYFKSAYPVFFKRKELPSEQ
ncbi:MAG: hypothetical protein HYV97_11725 [Bdellovibrio sp.]|nr:hypothetical protein [Bdellovibrio sp.]